MTDERAEWLRRVESRVERFADGGDPSTVLGDEAVHEAVTLLDIVGDKLDVEALVAVGWLYLCRAQAAEDTEAESELLTATSMFAPVFEAAPEHVPVDLHDHFRDEQAAEPGLAEFRAYLAGGEPALLDTAAELLRNSVERTAETDPALLPRSANLASVLRERFVLSGHEQDLDEAITVVRRSLASEADSPSRGGALAVLAAALHSRYELTSDLHDLESAVRHYEDAVADERDPAAISAVVLTNLANALVTRSESTGDTADLDKAVATLRQALDSAGEAEGLGEVLSTLGLALRSRYVSAGSSADLDEALHLGRKALELCADDGFDASGAQANLASTLSTCHRMSGDPAYLVEAVHAAESAVNSSAGTHREACRAVLADLLHDLFLHTGDESNLARAIELGQEAVTCLPKGSPHLAASLTNLNYALQSRCDLTGMPADAERAVTSGRQAVAAAADRHAEMPRALSMLSLALLCRYELISDAGDLDEAVGSARHATEMVGDHHTEQASFWGNLGAVLLSRFPLTADPADLDEAITSFRKAVTASPQENDVATHESNLAVALSFRHERGSGMKDLELAVESSRNSMQSTGRSHPALGHRSMNLSAVLRERFESFGAIEDIDEAIVLARLAVDSVLTRGPLRAARLSALTTTLQSRYGKFSQAADLDEAVLTAREAVSCTPPRSAALPGRRTNLGNVLTMRAERHRSLEDLVEAVTVLRKAVASAPVESHDHGALCANLAMALVSLHQWTNDVDHLMHAVGWARAAVAETPAGRPDHTLHLSDLGIALADLFTVTGDETLATEARSCFAAASADEGGPALLRMIAARWHGRVAAGQALAEEAAVAYSLAVDLISSVTWHGLDRRSREEHLITAQGLAVDAGAWSIHSGRHEHALGLLEAGRSVLWSQLLDTGSTLDEVAEKDQALATRLMEVGRQLNRLTTPRVRVPK